MGGGGKTKQPELSAEERSLLTEQVTQLREQRTQTQQNLKTQELLQPILFKQLGLTPQRETPEAFNQRVHERGSAVAAEHGQLQQQFDALVAQHGGRPEDAVAQSPQAKDILTRMQALSAEGQQLERAASAGPSITGFEETADPLAGQKADIERLFTERSLAALRGELPVDPALMRDVEDQRQTLEEVFRNRLGSGYQTSSPYLEAKQRLEESVSMVLDSARRGDLSMAESLGIGRGQATQTGALRQVGGALSITGGGGATLGAALSGGGGYQGPLSTLGALRSQQTAVANQNAQLAYQQRQQEGAAIGAGTALATSFIPYVGPFIAPLAGAGASAAYTGSAPTQYGGGYRSPYTMGNVFGGSAYNQPQGVTYYSNPDYGRPQTAPADAGGYR